MKTDDNLKAAFAGESQARNKYLAFSKKADEEGYKGIAKLFRAAAEAETIHAQLEFRALGGVKSTAENLKIAIEGETYEFTEMYPVFLKEADSEAASPDAKRAFRLANDAEKVHADLYKAALDTLGSKTDIEYYICPVCGNLVKGDKPDKCTICGAPGSRFYSVG